MTGIPTLIQWAFEPCFDYEEQTYVMAELQDVVIKLTQRIRENTIDRPDLVAVGALGVGPLLTVTRKDVFLLVEAGFEYQNSVPAYIRVVAGSRELMERKGKDLRASMTRHGEVYNTKVTGPN